MKLIFILAILNIFGAAFVIGNTIAEQKWEVLFWEVTTFISVLFILIVMKEWGETIAQWKVSLKFWKETIDLARTLQKKLEEKK